MGHYRTLRLTVWWHKILTLGTIRIAHLLLLCPGVFAAAVPPLVCVSGGAVATLELEVISPSSHAANHPLPLRTISRVEEGDTIRYQPVLRPHEERKGDVSLVLVPADRKATGRDKLLVFDPRPAERPQQWKVPWRTSFVAFVYGPSGLNVKKVEAFLDRDDQLVAELADYADKTAKAEALITALSSSDNSHEAVSAALQGFSSKYGTSVQVSRTAPVNQQAMVMLQTLDPTVATYDPIAAQGTQPIGQTAGLATSVAEMFFGSPIGLAAGGTAMLLNFGALAFPRSEFRSAFSQPLTGDTLGLCGKVGASAARTRVAYLWAIAIPNAAHPQLTTGKANSLPAGTKSPLPLTGPEQSWKFLDHARTWTLHPDNGKPLAVKIQVLANTKSIELDLGKDVKPGRYSLEANWDWDPFQVDGFFEVRPLTDFAKAKLTPAAQDRLIGHAGKVPLTLEGADFEFVSKVELKKLNDEFASASTVPFVLPHGLREGEQDHIDVQVDTGGLEPGAYKLMMTQVDGKSHDVPLKILPALPVIENLPLAVNQDVSASAISFILKGQRLDLLKALELSQGTASLSAATAGGTERRVVFNLGPGLTSGATVSARAMVADRSEPLSIASALRVIESRPVISSVMISPLPVQVVHLEDGELPGGLPISAMIRATHVPAAGGVRLECEQTSTGAATLLPGQQSGSTRLERLTPDQFFLTFDTSAWVNGCTLEATITSGVGDSPPHRIGRIVDLPAIEEFTLEAGANDAEVTASLTGRHLETIEKAGWSTEHGVPVSMLPQPLSGDSIRQELQVSLSPPPTPDAVLYLWLRGESTPRVTTVRAN